MNNNKIVLGDIEYNLSDKKDLLELLVRFTDGVYNSSDTASFDEEEVAAIKKIREYRETF